MRRIFIIAALAVATAGCARTTALQTSASSAAAPQTSSARIAFKCIVGRWGGGSGLLPGPATGRYLNEGAYRVTAYNRNQFPVTVSRITIVYYGPDGQEAGSDDRGFGDGGYGNDETITAGAKPSRASFCAAISSRCASLPSTTVRRA